MKYSLRSLMIVVTLVCVVLTVCGVAAKLIKPSVIHSYRFDATHLPQDDVALREWLLHQPGVVRAEVIRKGNVVRVYFIISRDVLGNPKNPDLPLGFNRAGYKGEGEYVR